MAFYAEQILEAVSYALVERVVNTTLGIDVVSGAQHVPLVTPAAYVGAMLVVGVPGVDGAEIITVSSVDATGFTATFANSHPATDSLRGATFSAGQPGNALFTQAEVLGYLASAQNDFLMRTRCVYNVSPVAFVADERFYDQPADALRVERIATQNESGDMTSLFNTSQEELDTLDSSWSSEQGPIPAQWFQDEIQTARFGVRPIPTVGGSLELWYSQRGGASLGLMDKLLVPDCFAHYLKYRVLGKCFSKDGEQRNPLLAEYGYRRYKFGLMLATKFMIGMQVGLRQGVPAAVAFNPMAVPDAQNPASLPPPENPDA